MAHASIYADNSMDPPQAATKATKAAKATKNSKAKAPKAKQPPKAKRQRSKPSEGDGAPTRRAKKTKVAEADPVASELVPVENVLQSMDFEMDEDTEFVGQFTRGKRCFIEIVQEQIDDLIAKGEVPESLRNSMRLARQTIQLGRLASQKFMALEYVALAQLARLSNRKTVGADVLHTHRYLRSASNANLLPIIQKDIPLVHKSVVSDLAGSTPIANIKKPTMRQIRRSIEINTDDHRELPDAEYLTTMLAASSA